MLKQYVIVPKSLKMSPGKIAAQVAHATYMALYKQKKEFDKETIRSEDDLIDTWRKSGMCVVVLQCKDTVQLMGIAKYLEQWSVVHHMYIDEGHTEVSMGTPTALSTGVVGDYSQWMFSKLELYK